MTQIKKKEEITLLCLNFNVFDITVQFGCTVTPVMATTLGSPGLLMTFPDLQTGLYHVRQVFQALPRASLRANCLTGREVRRVGDTVAWYEDLMFVHGWSAMIQDIQFLRDYIFLKKGRDYYHIRPELQPIVCALGLAVRHDYEESCEIIIREGRLDHDGTVYNYDLHREFLYSGVSLMPGVEVDWDQIFFTMLRVEHAQIDDGGTLILTLVYGSLQRVRALLRAGASKSTKIPRSFPQVLCTPYHRFPVDFEDTPLSFAVRNKLERISPQKFQELEGFALSLRDRCLIAIRRSLGSLTRERAKRLELPTGVENDLLFR